MEKDACAVRVPTRKFPRKKTLRQRIVAATGACCQVPSRRPNSGREILVMLTNPFSSPTAGGVFLVGDSIIARTADLAL